MSLWIEALLSWRGAKAWAKQRWKDAPLRSRQVLIAVAALVLLAFCSGTAVAATSSVVTEGTYSLRQGNTNVQTGLPSLQACVAAAEARSESQRVSRTYNCDRTADRVAVTYTAPTTPVNCVVSAWSAWTYTPWVVNGNVETRTGTRTRTVTTQPANGGTACPALTETTTETRPYTPPTAWVRAVAEGGIFRLYATATVRYGADTRWVERSFQAGLVECGNHVFGDPAYNTVKACEVNPGSALQGTPQPATGTAALTWQAPTLYVDGTALPPAELGGFRIYQGASAAGLNRVAEVGSGVRAHTVEALAAGTHYFAISAVATNGTESALSGVGSKTVP